MYKHFYGLTRSPFEISPDPFFLLPTPRHNEALAALYYGVRRYKGFVVMTGEVGTGKTLLLRCLLDLFARSHIAYACVFNPALSPLQFLQYVMGEFGLQGNGKTKGEMLVELSHFLMARHRQGYSTVLVVDEGQVLDRATLEEIRLLTNLETTQHKLLQIVLVGQSELEETLACPNLRQLRQRIALWCRLEPFTEQETARYIARRLEVAGLSASRQPLFSPEAVSAIHHFSRGIPRLINIVCDNCLIASYGQQAPTVTPDVVALVAAEFRLHSVEEPAKKNGNGNGNGNGDYKAVLRKLRAVLDSFQEIEASHIPDSLSSKGAERNEQRL